MDQRIIDLYDEFTRGAVNRRQLLDRLARLAGGAAAAASLLPILEDNYATRRSSPRTTSAWRSSGCSNAADTRVTGYLARLKPAAGGRPSSSSPKTGA